MSPPPSRGNLKSPHAGTTWWRSIESACWYYVTLQHLTPTSLKHQWFVEIKTFLFHLRHWHKIHNWTQLRPQGWTKWIIYENHKNFQLILLITGTWITSKTTSTKHEMYKSYCSAGKFNVWHVGSCSNQFVRHQTLDEDTSWTLSWSPKELCKRFQFQVS